MRRAFAVAFLRIVVVGGAALMTSPSSAEPMLGDDGISIPSAEPTQKQDTGDAVALFKAGDYDGSLKLWREAAKANADFPPAETIMAQLFLQANMRKEAQEALQRAIADAPSDPEAYMLLAGLAMQRGDAAKAEPLYEKADSLMAGFNKSEKRKAMLQPQVYWGLAGIAETHKDWAGMRKVLDACLKLDPKNGAVRQRLAYCLFQQKDIDGALANLREGQKIEPKSLTPEIVLAQFYQQSRDPENAKKWMLAGVAAAPNDLKTRLAAGYVAVDLNDKEEGMKHAIAAMQIDPMSIDAKMLRGLISVCQKDYVASELFFSAALEKMPNDFIASNNLSLALIEQNDPPKSKRALELSEANFKKFPKSTSAASTYGWVLYKLGRLDDAEKALQAAAAIGPMSVDTSYYMARLLIDRGHKDEAKKVLEAGLKRKGLSMCRIDAEQLLKQLSK
jgi:tetratricopeptide (TPR) repeat protein